MKLALVVLVAVLVVAQGQERLCRGNCQDTDSKDDGTSAGCQCDDACVDAEDCCDSYFDFCSDDTGCVGRCGSTEQYSDDGGRCYCDDACEDASDCCDDHAAVCGGSNTDDTACQGCPDGPQTSTARGSDRGSCYCDAECVDSGDCCPSFTKYCGDAIVADARVRFCGMLSTSKSVFCDTAMRKAYYLTVATKIDANFDTSTQYRYWDFDTYMKTCVIDPEIVEEEAGTCFNSPTGFNWRYGCSGLNSVWAQRCESPSCRDRDCDAPWRRDYWGQLRDVNDAMDPVGVENNPNHPEFPKTFGAVGGDDQETKASQAGRCLITFQNKCDIATNTLPADDADRVYARTYGCLDATYDAADVEFLDWEKVVNQESNPWTGGDYQSIASSGNGDSAKRKFLEFESTFAEIDEPEFETAFADGYPLGGRAEKSCPSLAPTAAPTT